MKINITVKISSFLPIYSCTSMVIFDVSFKELKMSNLGLIVLIIVLLAVLPTWPYSTGWGYGPSGGVGIVLIILIVLLLTRGG